MLVLVNLGITISVAVAGYGQFIVKANRQARSYTLSAVAVPGGSVPVDCDDSRGRQIRRVNDGWRNQSHCLPPAVHDSMKLTALVQFEHQRILPGTPGFTETVSCSAYRDRHVD